MEQRENIAEAEFVVFDSPLNFCGTPTNLSQYASL